MEAAVLNKGCENGFVVGDIGSLDCTSLRLAEAQQALELGSALEVLTPAGSVAVNGSHLHASLADAHWRMLGRHLGYGCRARTTAEVLLALLPAWHFSRELEAATGYDEFALRRRQGLLG
jgi:predicted DNA-binding protein with PD1-like motif